MVAMCQEKTKRAAGAHAAWSVGHESGFGVGCAEFLAALTSAHDPSGDLYQSGLRSHMRYRRWGSSPHRSGSENVAIGLDHSLQSGPPHAVVDDEPGVCAAMYVIPRSQSLLKPHHAVHVSALRNHEPSLNCER